MSCSEEKCCNDDMNCEAQPDVQEEPSATLQRRIHELQEDVQSLKMQLSMSKSFLDNAIEREEKKNQQIAALIESIHLVSKNL